MTISLELEKINLSKNKSQGGKMRTYSIIVTIVALAAIAGLIYFFLMSNNYRARITQLETQATPTLESSPIPKSPTPGFLEEEATPQTTASNLLTYRDTVSGFSFQYPRDVKVVKSTDSASKENKGNILSVTVQKINEIEDLPAGWDKETAFQDKEALAKGDPSVLIDWPLEGSLKVVKIPSALAKKFMILAGNEVCDVQFTQIALIYKNDYRIVLKLAYQPDSDIVKNNPKYFTVSKENCGDAKIWKDQKAFYEDLVAGKTDALSQSWYKAFETILSSFRFSQS